MSRPPLDPELRRNHRATLHLRKRELETFRAAAEQARLPFPEWTRKTLMAAAEAELEEAEA